MDEPLTALMVPMGVDVLYLRHDTTVLEPTADFSRLPYPTKGPDANPDVAYLSEEILSRPFEDDGYALRAGIHLHWSLPEGLRRGSSHGVLFGMEARESHARELDAGSVPSDLRDAFSAHGVPLSAEAVARATRRSGRWHVIDPASHRTYTARLESHWEVPPSMDGVRQTARLNIHAHHVQFPVVPNRWLVTRTDAAGTRTQWVVESDYVHPPDGQPADAITYPYTGADHPQPYRRLGRTWPLHEWMAKDDHEGAYVDQLTAIGYGEPTFASFYPNCHGVFGFHDGEPAGGEPSRWGTVTYDVIGWYADPARDCVQSAAFIDALDATVTKYSLAQHLTKPDPQALRTFDALRFETLKRRYGWTFADTDRKAFPRRTLCYARVVIDCARFDFSDPGRGDEASRKVTVAVGNTGTEALSAYLAECLPHGGADQKWKIEEQLEALHLSPALQGRHLDVDAKFREARHAQAFSGVASGAGWTIRPAGAEDGKGNEPPGVPPPVSPEIGRLLDRLNAEQVRCDRLDHEVESMQTQLFADWYKYMLCAYPPGDAIDGLPDMDDARAFIETQVLGALSGKREDARAARASCAQLCRELAAALVAFAPKTAPLELEAVPAPRYWQPSEPVVLLAGEASREVIARTQDGPRACQLIPGPGRVIELGFDAMLARVAEIAKDEASGLHRYDRQAWRPFMLEWRVAVHAGSLAERYMLPAGGVDLALKDGARLDVPSRTPSLYAGRSIVTAYATRQLREALSAYLQREVLPGYWTHAHTPEASRKPDDLETSWDSIVAWYRDAGHGQSDEVTDSLVAAFDELRRQDRPTSWCITQALSGFNDALLMHKRTLQLPIDEPLGFEDSRAFTARVREAVGTRNRTAPQPADDFVPVRAGHLELRDLRLVDTFGRVQDLVFGHRPVITTELMNVKDRRDVIELRPRLVQPARLNFRWLAGRGDGAAPTLVHGFVVHNRFERSLVVHAAGGELLGSIGRVVDPVTGGATVRWLPAPGSLLPSSEQEIDDPHLRALATWLLHADLDDFASRLERNLASIEPQHLAHHRTSAFLLGRPLAVVRATLGLEIRGLPAVDQGWSAFGRALEGADPFRRDSDGYTRVAFPIRLGDPGQLDDGLVALWRETAVAPGGVALQELPHVAGGEPQIRLALSDPEVPLTLLVDPRCVVHATSGILPVKAIGLPHDEYVHALEQLQSAFRVGPVLMPTGRVRLPLPAQRKHAWRWVERRDGVLRSVGTIERPVTDTVWEPQELRDGWVRRTRVE